MTYYVEAIRFGKKRGTIIPCTVFTDYESAQDYIKRTETINRENGYYLRIKEA